jgi:hypothetical protein
VARGRRVAAAAQGDGACDDVLERRSFVYFGGAFDLSWLPWFYENIARTCAGA